MEAEDQEQKGGWDPKRSALRLCEPLCIICVTRSRGSIWVVSCFLRDWLRLWEESSP